MRARVREFLAFVAAIIFTNVYIHRNSVHEGVIQYIFTRTEVPKKKRNCLLLTGTPSLLAAGSRWQPGFRWEHPLWHFLDGCCCVFVYACLSVCVCVHVYLYLFGYVCFVYTLGTCALARLGRLLLCVCICMFKCMCMFTGISISIYVCMCIYVGNIRFGASWQVVVVFQYT